MSEHEQQPGRELFKPKSLDEVKARLIQDLKETGHLDSGGNATPLTDPDLDLATEATDEVAYQSAVELLAQGGTDPGSLMDLFREAREKYPDYMTGDSERDITWQLIDDELKGDDEDNQMGMSDLGFTLATLVSEMVTGEAEADPTQLP